MECNDVRLDYSLYLAQKVSHPSKDNGKSHTEPCYIVCGIKKEELAVRQLANSPEFMFAA